MRKLTYNLSLEFWIILFVISTLLLECDGNTPPILRISNNWVVDETEQIGQVVTRFSVSYGGNNVDNLTFNITGSDFGQDGSKYFKIDPSGKILVAQSLKGLGGQIFYVKVVVSDGGIPVIHIARVTVQSPGQSSHSNGIGGPFSPPSKNSFINQFNAPFNPPVQYPPVNQVINYNQENHSNRFKPMLNLNPNTKWVIPSDSPVGTQIYVIDVTDIAGEGVTYRLHPPDLVTVDNETGAVYVNTQFGEKIGVHVIEVTVSNRFGAVKENVTLTITNASDQSPTTTAPTNQYIYNNQKPPFTAVINGNKDINTDSQKTIYHVNNHVSDPVRRDSLNGPSGNTTTGDALSVTMIAVVSILGAIPIIGGLAYLGYRLYYAGKTKLTQIDPVSIYSKKDGNAYIIDGKQGSQINGIADRIRNFLQKNNDKCEDSPPKVASRKISHSHIITEEDHWEIPRFHLKIMGMLGEGCFGQVWKAECKTLPDEIDIVAVKTLKENASLQERKDLLQELKVLKSLGKHPNVVSLLACCTEKDPVFVVLEYMVGGKLQSYLRASRGLDHSYNNLHGISNNLSPKDLTIFALQIAKGMDYLAKNGIIHRDLAARNVLVGENKICKVADFGFARDVANNHIYERKSDGRLPIRWMAPESLFDNIFSVKSDVWSFGILLWEIVTLGSTPYPGLSPQEVMHKVKNGYRLEKPDHCRREFYNMMFYCWDKDSINRPTYAELIETLENLILSEVDYIQLDRFPDHGYYNFIVNSQSGELL